MKKIIFLFLVLLWACQANENKATSEIVTDDETPKTGQGYVLKHGEGEILDESDLWIIKASPKSGTQGSVLVYDEMPRGSTSGIHYHTDADELFYVLEGFGTILIGEQDIAIESGDVIFIPAGMDHRITSSVDHPLKVIYFLDKPGLDELFRMNLDRTTMTIEEFNAIAEKYGAVWKTFD